MTKEEFREIRQGLDLSLSEMARALRIKSCRAIRYYESGDREVSGPVSLLMELYRDGKLI